MIDAIDKMLDHKRPSLSDIVSNERSLTGAYLSGQKKIEVPAKRTPNNPKKQLVLVLVLQVSRFFSAALPTPVLGIDYTRPLGT